MVWLQVDRPHGLVVGGGMVLGGIVAVVHCTRLPVHTELSLPYSVPDPIEAHVHGLGSALLDSVIGNTIGY